MLKESLQEANTPISRPFCLCFVSRVQPSAVFVIESQMDSPLPISNGKSAMLTNHQLNCRQQGNALLNVQALDMEPRTMCVLSRKGERPAERTCEMEHQKTCQAPWHAKTLQVIDQTTEKR